MQAMVSSSCEFYGNIDSHHPVNCQLADILDLALQQLDRQQTDTCRGSSPAQGAPPVAPPALDSCSDERSSEQQQCQEQQQHVPLQVMGSGEDEGQAQYMYLAQQPLAAPGELSVAKAAQVNATLAPCSVVACCCCCAVLQRGFEGDKGAWWGSCDCFYDHDTGFTMCVLA